MDAEHLDEAVRSGDLDELLRIIDGCCDERDWSSLARLEQLCERAYETGRQLWPAASHAAYRLALEAPAPFAASVLREGVGRFAPGPIPEVAAQAHTWAELAPHAPAGAPAVLAAHERVVRGEVVAGSLPEGPDVIELPAELADWEPRYALAEYKPHGADFPTPPLPRLEPAALPERPTVRPPDEGVAALIETTRVWSQESNGTSDAVVVDGDALAAIAALGVRTARVAPLSGADALAYLAWAGSSGGAHGHRPGTAAGRFSAWWALSAIVGLLDDWPPETDALGAALARLRWLAWDAAEPATGWRLQLAVEDPARGRAWAVSATDAA